MAEIKFYANVLGSTSATLIEHTAGSGLGFYGSSHGVSVPVGSQQRTTYVTNADGTYQGTQLNNTAMSSSGTISTKGEVAINGNPPITLDNLPNNLCPLNLRFEHSTAVRVQNCKLRIFDRNNIQNPASGVTTWVFEARHPSAIQAGGLSLGFRGNKDTTASAGFRWTQFSPPPDASMADMTLTSSPGVSGLNTDTTDTDTSLLYSTRQGGNHESTRHDWYVALSSEPESIGSKTNYGLYFTVEYL